jgi:hypothetical protein
VVGHVAANTTAAPVEVGRTSLGAAWRFFSRILVPVESSFEGPNDGQGCRQRRGILAIGLTAAAYLSLPAGWRRCESS